MASSSLKSRFWKRIWRAKVVWHFLKSRAWLRRKRFMWARAVKLPNRWLLAGKIIVPASIVVVSKAPKKKKKRALQTSKKKKKASAKKKKA